MSQQKKSSIVVIALSIICVLLASGFIVTLAFFLPNQSKLTEQEQTIMTLNNQISALEQEISNAPDINVFQAQINELKTQVSALNNTLVNANQQLSPLRDIVNLNKYSLIYTNTTVQAPQTNATVLDSDLNYAGYITVQATSNSTTTYAMISYTYKDFTMVYNQTLGNSGSALFPVLPANIKMVLGNLETENGTQVVATITYYY
jgi:Tfp pilus assembly protein PilN